MGDRKRTIFNRVLANWLDHEWQKRRFNSDYFPCDQERRRLMRQNDGHCRRKRRNV